MKLTSMFRKVDHLLNNAPKLPNIMEAYLARPKPKHAPEGNKHGDDIGDNEHALGANLPMTLNVPEA